MKKVLTIASALVLSTGAAFSQGLADAYKYVPNGDLNGTARSMSMGGAFGSWIFFQCNKFFIHYTG